MAQKDIEDLDQIIPNCDKGVLNKIIEEVLDREDLFESKKEELEEQTKLINSFLKLAYWY